MQRLIIKEPLFFYDGWLWKLYERYRGYFDLEPRHFGALDGLSRILIYYKNYEEAFKVYEEMKRLMPNDITVDMKIDRLNQIISNET